MDYTDYTDFMTPACKHTTPEGIAGLACKSAKSRNPRTSAVQTANDIVKALGGSLEIETNDGKGSTFRISLSGS